MRVAQLANYQPKKISGERNPELEDPGSQRRNRTQINKIAAAALTAVVMDRGDTAPSKT
jgi:hypothetical protein